MKCPHCGQHMWSRAILDHCLNPECKITIWRDDSTVSSLNPDDPYSLIVSAIPDGHLITGPKEPTP